MEFNRNPQEGIMETRKSSTITVHGQRVSNRTNRRYSVIAVRPEAVQGMQRFSVGYREWCRISDHCHVSEPIVEYKPATYVPFAEIVKRSDNAATAIKAARQYSPGPGSFAVVVDTTTGSEIFRSRYTEV